MMKVNTLALALLCSGSLATVACSGGGGGGSPDGGNSCTSSTQCTSLFHDPDGGTRSQVCINSVCVPICSVSTQCAAGLVCESGICDVPACGSADDCNPGQTCSGGSCVTAATSASVASCDVTPNPVVVDSGSKVKLAAVAKDSSGKALGFGGFTWNVTSGPGTVDSTGLVTATGQGAITVSAAAGSTTSCSGTVNAYAANTMGASGVVRVVAISEFSKQPVANASVTLDLTTKTTAVDGSVSFSGVASSTSGHDIHVIAAGFDYFSVLGTSNTDLLVPLVPSVAAAQRSGFQGTLLAHCPSANPSCTDPTFASLNVPGEAVHLAFFGSGIPGSPIDISVQTLLGASRPVVIKALGQSISANLPSGLVLGLDNSAVPPSEDDLFGTGTYTINAEAGKRILWGIGGNLSLTDVAPILSSFLGGSKVDIGATLKALLPLFGKLQAGQIVDVQAPNNAAVGGTPTFTPVSVPLNTLLRLHAAVQLPDLPKQDGKYVGAVAALGGSLDYPLGFIPLGLTASIANTDASGNNLAKVLDPTCDTSNGTAACATSLLPMSMAPQNNGLEGTGWGFVSLALNLTGLNIGSTAPTTIGLSGLVKPVMEVKSSGTPATGQLVDFSARGFMSLPDTNSAVLTVNTRSFTIPAIDSTAKFIRIGVQGTSGLNWNLWMPASYAGRSITLPDPTKLVAAGTPDPVTDTPSSLFLAASLTNSLAFGDISGFGNVTLDQLGANIDAFALVTTKVQ